MAKILNNIRDVFSTLNGMSNLLSIYMNKAISVFFVLQAYLIISTTGILVYITLKGWHIFVGPPRSRFQQPKIVPFFLMTYAETKPSLTLVCLVHQKIILTKKIKCV